MNGPRDPVGWNGPAENERAIYERGRPVFDAALELPVGERADFVRRACAGDAALERRVRRLLDVSEALGDAMEAPPRPHGDHLPAEVHPGRGDDGVTVDLPDGATAAPVVAGPEVVGARIGAYTILERIGEGGFGAVYRAEQPAPMQREVAIKIIRPGMDSEAVMSRFRAEAQALARMQSPHIAKVIEAGATATGRPYFVMELVRGEPITRYCDARALSIRERLELFVQVCGAVQHAHHKGVFHRDLKPTNILALTQDGRPFAVVIDFGIAKAIETSASVRPGATQHGQPLGTPGHMSPEQVQGSPDIDARTDVYSLGVLLYELLTGATPLEWAGLRDAPFDQVRRFICETDAPSPSTRLGRSSPMSTRIALSRATEPARLGAAVRGDLDWIVAKAMATERGRRYSSVNELAADIDRHLRNEPVLARPPGTGYALGKFVRRHRAAVIGFAAVSAALLLGLVGTTIGLVQARRATTEAEGREREIRFIAVFEAQMLAGIDAQRSGIDLMSDLVSRHETALRRRPVDDAERARRAAALRRELLEVNATDVAVAMIDRAILAPAVAAIDRQTGVRPTIAAQLRHTLANAYSDLGRPDEAMALREHALRTRRAELGDDHPETLESIDDVGVWRQQGGDPAGAEALLREALDGRRRVLGDDHRDTLGSMAHLGSALLAQGRMEDATPWILGALESRRAHLGPDHRDTIESLQSAGQLALAQGEFTAAQERFDEAMGAALRAFGPEHRVTMDLYTSVATQLMRQGHFAEAEPYVRASLEASRRVLGEDHPITVKRLGNLGAMLSLQDKLEEAESCCREAFNRIRAARGEEHPETVGALANLARVVQLRGRLAEAAPLHHEAMERARRAWGDDDQRTIGLISNVGASLMTRGLLVESEPFVREALERRRRVLPPDHPDTLASIAILGVQLQEQGDGEEAAPLFREALEKRRRVLGPAHPDTLHSMRLLGALLREQGEPDGAEGLLREALTTRQREHPADTADAAGDMEALGTLLRRQGRLDEARGLLERSLELRRSVLSDDHPDTLLSMRSLALLRRDEGDLAAAERLLREATERWRRAVGEEHPAALELAMTLASVLAAQSRWDEAEALLLPAIAAGDRTLPPRHPVRSELRRAADDLRAAREAAGALDVGLP